VLGAHVFIRTALRGAEYEFAKTLREFAPESVHPFLHAFYSGLVRRPDGPWLQDGDCVDVAERFLTEAKSKPSSAAASARRLVDPEATDAGAARLERVADAADLASVPLRWREWTREHFIVQGNYLAALYRAVAALARDEPAIAAGHVERSLQIRAALATGPWTGWYAGDKKANWPGVLERLRTLSPAQP
jgi:hypothetical protein